MYAYLRGTIVYKAADQLILEAGAVAYQLKHDAAMSGRFPTVGQEAKIWTYLYVREDEMSLYAFPSQEEKSLFELLLTVSGIGPKVASALTAELSPSVLALAVLNDDVQQLCRVKGIGKKGAQRLILELKDKLKAFARDELALEPTAVSAVEVTGTSELEEALQALLVLGYQPREAKAALEKVQAAVSETPTVEQYIRLALRQLAVF